LHLEEKSIFFFVDATSFRFFTNSSVIDQINDSFLAILK